MAAKKAFEYEVPEELGSDWAAWRPKVVVRAKQINEHDKFTVGKQEGKAGQFVVVGPDKTTILDEEDLEARYEPCSVTGGVN